MNYCTVFIESTVWKGELDNTAGKMIWGQIDLFINGFGWNFHQAELLTQFFEFWGLLTWIWVFRGVTQGGNPGGSRGAWGPKLKLDFLDDIGHEGALFGAACVTDEDFDNIFDFRANPGRRGPPQGSPPGVGRDMIFWTN